MASHAAISAICCLNWNHKWAIYVIFAAVYPRLLWNLSDKLCFEPSQIATIQESLSSQFVICRSLWSRPWRHKLSPITLKTCSRYLGEYPGSLLTWIWKVVFLPILVLFHWYICIACNPPVRHLIADAHSPIILVCTLEWSHSGHWGVCLSISKND